MRLSDGGRGQARMWAALAARVRDGGRPEGGFTLIVALGVLLVTSMLLVAGFTAVDGDTHLAREDVSRKEAYYAALAGVQGYEYQLEKNPDFWQSCETLPIAGEPKVQEGTRYQVELLPASTAPEGTEKCSTAKPFESVIQSKGSETNTFRVKSTGYAGKEHTTLVATFGVNGFLDYVYFTRFEDEDPALDEAKTFTGGITGCSQELKAEAGTEGREKFEAKEKALGHNSPCGGAIEFAPEDGVRGPMHTDDSALVCGSTEFGRKQRLEKNNPDVVEIRGSTYSDGGGCSDTPIFNTTSGKALTGEEASVLVPPEEDTSLGAYVEAGYEFEGVTTLELEGSEVTVTNAQYNGGKPKKIPLPKNGLIYVQGTGACTYEYEQTSADTASDIAKEVPCGNAYVKGNYSESLTIGAEREIVIKGNITPTGITPPSSGTEIESELPGTNVLGLIASKYVRIYHPCTGSGSSSEELKDPWIYAAMLSTGHSFAVDNYACGHPLGHLNVVGAIAQNFRGIVGTSGGTGFLKNYNYDERLATDEPPYFLEPLKAGWRVIRETSTTAE